VADAAGQAWFASRRDGAYRQYVLGGA